MCLCASVCVYVTVWDQANAPDLQPITDAIVFLRDHAESATVSFCFVCVLFVFLDCADTRMCALSD